MKGGQGLLGRWDRSLIFVALLLNAVICGGETGEDDPGPLIMASVEINACDEETAQCFQNDGPHPVLSYDTANMDPSSMQVRLLLDGAILLTSTEPSNDLTVIMRSPHERLSHTGEREKGGEHLFVAQVVSSDGTLFAEARADFTFNLIDTSRPPPPPPRPPCPVMHGSEASFDYRGGDGHGTHQPVLHAAVLGTEGPVVEFGMGFFSTPMLHDLCQAAGRRLVSMDTVDSWVEKFRHLSSDTHEVMLVKGWDAEVEPRLQEIFGASWGVAFIDQHPEHTRIEVARRVKAAAGVVVMHDAYRQLGQPGFPAYRAEFPHFREYFPPRPFPVLAGPPTLAASMDPALLPDVDMYHYDQWCVEECRGPLPPSSASAAPQCRPALAPREGIPWQAEAGGGGAAGRGKLVVEDEEGEGAGTAGAALSAVVKAALKASAGKVLVVGTGAEAGRAVKRVCDEAEREMDWVSVGGDVQGDVHVQSWAAGRAEVEAKLGQEEWGVVVVDFMGFEARAEMVRKALQLEDGEPGRPQWQWQWLVVHDCERLVKGDLLRLPTDTNGRCFEEHFPPRPWPVLSGPSTLLVAGSLDVRCSVRDAEVAEQA